ncbi:MAG: hypothetical protein JSS41_06310 [Proteobacteria bacterium]|nr:hypothetical protein [Pseudomonadota bacterium]MBS0463524.1 hypothetical protein [Pseudomonadota bacterium]
MASSSHDQIVPFWNRLPKVMGYPLAGASMVSIVLLGAAQVLRMLPLGWILALLATIAMYRYAFACLRSTADGFLQAPEVALGEDRSLGGKFIWLMVILVVVTAIGAAALGQTAGMVLAVFFAVCLPGATMTLALEESLVEALNPMKWLRIIAAIGWSYLAMIGVCVAISMSQGWAQDVVVRFLPLPVALIGLGIISNYVVVALFHLMGYVLYQYHEELGLMPAAVQRQVADAPAADPDQDKLDAAAALVREGKLPEAIDVLGQALRRGSTPAVHAQYRRMLRAANDNEGLLTHGRQYIAVLIDQDDARGAVDLLRQCQALDPAFAPESPAHISKLAHMAAHVGQAQAALQLLDGFAQRFPNSQYVARNGLLAAELLHEKLGRDAQAREVLLDLKASHPNDPLMPEIDTLLATIERMIAATAKKSS